MSPRPRKERKELDPFLAELFPSLAKSPRAAKVTLPYPFLRRNLRCVSPRKVKDWTALKNLCAGLLSTREKEEGDLNTQRCSQELYIQLHSAHLVLPHRRKLAFNMILDMDVFHHELAAKPRLIHRGQLSWNSDGLLNHQSIRISSPLHQSSNNASVELRLCDPKHSFRYSNRLEWPQSGRTAQLQVELHCSNASSVLQVWLEQSWRIDPRVPLMAIPAKLAAEPSPVQSITYVWYPASGSRQMIVQGWSCPFCKVLDYGSFARIKFHLDQEHPTMEYRQLTADTVSVWQREPKPDDKQEKRRLELAALSGRVETGTLADNVSELNELWQGGELPQTVYERDEVTFHWGHLPHERRYVMAMWNRWVAEKGPLLIHTGRSYTCNWVTRYAPVLAKYNLGAPLRDHLMILVGYKLIDSKTALMGMRIYKTAKAAKGHP